MRIAIVNDLTIGVEAIRRVLVGAGHDVAWVARNGLDAVKKCAADVPDLILMDLMMPVLSGTEAIRRIMAETPCPILVVTATGEEHRDRVFEALGAGALDVVKTPAVGGADSGGAILLLEKIESVMRLAQLSGQTQQIPSLSRASRPPPSFPLVAIGASAGGPNALMAILQRLPSNFESAIVIVQHLDPQFLPGLAQWLNQSSGVPVKLAQTNDVPAAGTALIAGEADHLILMESGRLGYTPDPVENVYRPSVDVFFDSVVKNWRGPVTGILLTGMGRDGAKGLRLLRENGHHTIAQDKATSAVYGMPKAAAALDAAVEILPLDRIPLALTKLPLRNPEIAST